MKKIYIIVFCLLFGMSLSMLTAAPAAEKTPQKRKFDWKKTEAENRKMREKFRMEHRKHIQKLKEFQQRYNAEKDPAKKEAVRAELKKFISEDFNKKIGYSRKRIENMKKFVSRLEEKQKLMESKSAEIVEKRTEDVLKGNIYPPKKRPQKQK